MMAFNRDYRYSDDPASSEIQRLLEKRKRLIPSRYIGDNDYIPKEQNNAEKDAISLILCKKRKLHARSYVNDESSCSASLR